MQSGSITSGEAIEFGKGWEVGRWERRKGEERGGTRVERVPYSFSEPDSVVQWTQ